MSRDGDAIGDAVEEWARGFLRRTASLEGSDLEYAAEEVAWIAAKSSAVRRVAGLKTVHVEQLRDFLALAVAVFGTRYHRDAPPKKSNLESRAALLTQAAEILADSKQPHTVLPARASRAREVALQARRYAQAAGEAEHGRAPSIEQAVFGQVESLFAKRELAWRAELTRVLLRDFAEVKVSSDSLKSARRQKHSRSRKATSSFGQA